MIGVVGADGPTEGRPPAIIEGKDGGLEVVAAHVIEAHVDTVGGGLAKLS